MEFRGTLRAEDRHYFEIADMGFVVYFERTSGMSQVGEPITVDIGSTTILPKGKSHWRAVHHNTDRYEDPFQIDGPLRSALAGDSQQPGGGGGVHRKSSGIK